MQISRLAVALGIATSVSGGSVCHAQAPIGGRAAGMGGAFVAVADDSSAVYWNPAGLATASFVSFELAFAGDERAPGVGPTGTDGGARQRVRFLAAGTPPLGVSFYQIRSFAVQGRSGGSAVQPGPDRQEGRRGVSALKTSHFGVTVLQSLAEGLAVGAIIKLVRGSATAGTTAAQTWDEAFDRADALGVETHTRGDIDAGVMWQVKGFQVGLAARNLTEPEFGDEEAGSTPRLQRAVRAGVAWGRDWPGTSPLIVAFDVDLTRTADPSGDRRDVAAGVESWWLARRVGVRGGVRASTVGEVRPVGTLGASFAVRPGVYVDAHAAAGSAGARGWGMAARLVY